MLKLQIIIGNVRPGRDDQSVSEWFEAIARKDDRFDIEIVDLAALNLPMMDGPNHPRLR